MGDPREPTQMYRKLWSGLAPGSNSDQYNKYASNKEKVNSKHRSLLDRNKNLEEVKKIIRTRLGRKAQNKYKRNPVVSSVRPRSTPRKIASGKSSETRPRKPWYSDGYPEFRVANENHKNRARQLKDVSVTSGPAGQRKRRKSIYFDEDGDEVPYYRSRSVSSSRRRDSTFTPVTNEQDVIHKTYTGRGIPTPTPRRSASMSSIRSRRNSTPLHKKIDHTPPYKRRGYSIGRLQEDVFKDVNQLYAENDTDMKQQLQSKLSKLPLQHHSIRHMKLDPEEKARLMEAYKNLERLKHLTAKMEGDIKNQYHAKRNNSVETIDTKFDKLRRSRPKETPIYMKNRSFTNMKLDPIEKQDDQPRRRRSTSKNGISAAPAKSKTGKTNGFRMGEVDHSTDAGEDWSTMDTLSTAVMVNTDSPGPNTDRALNSPTRPSMKGRQANQARPLRRIKRKNSKNGVKSITPSPSRFIQEAHVEKEVPLPDIVIKRRMQPSDTAETSRRASHDMDSPRKSIDAGRIHTSDTDEAVRYKTETSRKYIARHLSKDIDSPRNVTNTDRLNTPDSTEDVRSNSSEREPHAIHRHAPNEANMDIAIQSQGTHGPQETHLTRTTETIVTHSVRYRENSGQEHRRTVDLADTNEKVYGTLTNEDRTHLKNSEDIYEEQTVSPDQEHGYKADIVDDANETTTFTNNIETRSRGPLVTKRRLSKNVTSFDVVVDRHEYERKGHKVAEEKIRNSVSPQKAHRRIEHDAKTSVKETEDVIETTHVSQGAHHGTVDGHIDWKVVAEQSRRDSKPQVLTSVKKVVHETETVEEDDMPTGAGGKHQWRDLVQKYLKQPNPKVGKSADRTLLELSDDDYDDGVDIFERAKQKYQLEVDSDNSED